MAPRGWHRSARGSRDEGASRKPPRAEPSSWCIRCFSVHACAVLYRTPRFRCRACVGGTYASQHESERDRLFRRARAIRVRLGGQDSLLGPFPPKPKRMRWLTYRRLFEEAQRLTRAAFEETER